MIRNRKLKTLSIAVILVLVTATVAFAAWRQHATIRKLDVKEIGSLPPHVGIEINDQTKPKTVSVSFTSGVGFVIPIAGAAAADQGAIYEIDASTVTNSSIGTCDIYGAAPGDVAAVTVYVTDPTLLTDDLMHRVRKVDSGTTLLFFRFASGLPINTSSGTTFGQADAQGDYMELQNNMNGGVSGWVTNARSS